MTSRKDVTNNEIMARLDELEKAINDNRESSHKWRAITDAQLREYRLLLYGNGGGIGMDEQLRQILDYINAQKAALLAWKQWLGKLAIPLIVFFVTVIFTFIGQAMVFYFRIVPLLEGR